MTVAADHVEILLSTYNGALHLEAFLASLIDQDHPYWSLTVRDDGSRDRTIEILEAWRGRFPDRIRLIDATREGNIGVVRSFSTLMQLSAAAYVMLADQDDIWLPDKIRVTLGAMRRREERNAAPRPILVHTDLTVVDAGLRTVAPSFWRYQGLAPGRGRIFPRIMVENIVWGCTTMLNRPLVDIVKFTPPVTTHHDWWIALVAAAFGDIVSLKEPRILWRRHGRNESKISGIRDVSRWALADPRAARGRLARLFDEGRARVALFLEIYRGRLTPSQIAAAEAFLALPERGFLARRLDILRHGLFFGAPIRNAGLLALI